MDRALRDYISRKMEDNRRGDRRDYRYEDRHGTHGTYRVEGEYERDHRRDRREDYGYGGSHYDHREDMRRDRRDYREEDFEDGRDYGSDVSLTKQDIKRWKGMLENSDGTKGPHFEMMPIMTAADKLGVTFRDYDEKEFCMTVNMMYADYGEVIRHYVSQEKELHFCVELAKAFLEDIDGPAPSEKLALYFHCIVNA